MTEILSGILGAIIGGCFTFCMAAVIFASSRGNRASEEAGAPEGALIFNRHSQHPGASGSNRSVRVSKSVPVQSSGGRLD